MMHVEKPQGDLEDWHVKMTALMGPGYVDQTVRQALQYCWSGLAKDRRNLDELDRQFRRIVERALKDFRDDFEVFGRSLQAVVPAESGEREGARAKGKKNPPPDKSN